MTLQMHAIWDRYYSDADGLVFVIDATDRGRFDRAKNTLCESMQQSTNDTMSFRALPDHSQPLLQITSFSNLFDCPMLFPPAVSVLSHPALADIPLLVLANKADVKGAASTTEVHDRIARAEGSPLGGGGGGGSAAAAGGGGSGGALSSSSSGGGSVTVLTSGGASTGASSSGSIGSGSGSGTGAASGSGSKREYRVFTCSALLGEGVREACDWIVATSKRHMYQNSRR